MSPPQPIAPGILYEDELILAVDKPCGWATASREAGGPVLGDWLRVRWGRELAVAQRLETDASGVVLCAKTKAALDFVSGQFQSKTARRVFLALVALDQPAKIGVAGDVGQPGGGIPDAFTVDSPLVDGPGPVRIGGGRNGRPANSEFNVLERFGRFAWVECRPLTSCRHQVRAHLAAAGVPVLNDSTYGDGAPLLLLSDLKRGYKGRAKERPLLSRLALHGAKVEFVNPGTRLAQTVGSPLPDEFEIALKYLRRFGGTRPAR